MQSKEVLMQMKQAERKTTKTKQTLKKRDRNLKKKIGPLLKSDDILMASNSL